MNNIKSSSSLNSGPVHSPMAPQADKQIGTRLTKTGVPRSPGSTDSTFENSNHSHTENMEPNPQTNNFRRPTISKDQTLPSPQRKEVPKDMQEKMPETAAPDFLDESQEEEETNFNVVGQQKKRYRPGRRKDNSIQHETKLEILKEYLAGVNTKDIAEKYGIARSTVYYILEQPEIKSVMKSYKDSQTDMLMQVFKDNNKILKEIFTKYLEAANSDGRINESSLPQLFTVLGIIFDKNIKLEEMNMKREELELKKQEVSNTTNNEGLLSQFMQVLQNNNKLPPREDT